MKCVCYRRVSTDEQAESGAGIAAQEDACRALADRLGLPLVLAEVDDGVGGATPLDERRGFIDAMSLLEKGDSLVVSKRDRLGRQRLVLAVFEDRIERMGCRIVSAAGEGTETDEPADVLMRMIIDAFSVYERLMIKARTKAALAAKKKRGERVGRVPYGKTLVDDGGRSKSGMPNRLVPERREEEAVELIRTWRALRPEQSYQWIAEQLVRWGYPTKSGKPWDQSSVRFISINRGGDHSQAPTTT